MKRVLCAVGAALLMGATLLGQGPCCGGSPIVELKGKITRVQISPGEGTPSVEIKGEKETWTLYLGSIRYLMMQGFNPKVGEDIVAKAYKTPTSYMAASVTLPAQNRTVRLRDESGRPVWRGGRMR